MLKNVGERECAGGRKIAGKGWMVAQKDERRLEFVWFRICFAQIDMCMN
jgi:hypothetical protein